MCVHKGLRVAFCNVDQWLINDNYRMSVAHVGIKGITIVVIGVYLWCSEELSLRNQHLLRQAMICNDSGRYPVIIAGDFNTELSEILDWEGINRHALQVVVPADAKFTCKVSKDKKGRMLDYFLVSKSIVEYISRVEVEHNMPWHPHSAVRLVLKADLIHIKACQVVKADDMDVHVHKLKEEGKVTPPNDDGTYNRQ